MANLPRRLQERIDELLAPLGTQPPPPPPVDENPPAVVGELHVLVPEVSERKRAAPNAILRSSLFGIVGKGNRKYEKNVLKATIQGLTVKFTGEQLDQADLDVYLECIRRCAVQPLGKLVRFSIYDFLQSIGRHTGKSDHDWVKSCLARLFNGSLEVGNGRFFYSGHLINEQYRDEKTGEFVISLNPKIVVFFRGDMWTGLSLSERCSLKGKPLAQWLHGFYSTHATPFPYRVETIKELCGSNRRELYKFRYDLKKSLTDLSAVTGWQCEIDAEDKVNVKKS